VGIQGSETLELLRVLGMGGALTAAVVQAGRIVLELVRGRNRVAEVEALSAATLAEIEAESKAKSAEIEAKSRAETAKLRIELQLERERNRSLP
jgi:hypothetical protein